MAVTWASQVNENDLYYSAKTSQELSMSTNTIINFCDLSVETRQYLEKKYGLLKGKEVMSVTGPRYCHGGTCGCRSHVPSPNCPEGPMGAPGPACPRMARYDLKKSKYVIVNNEWISIWSDGDPLFAVIEDGQFKQL